MRPKRSRTAPSRCVERSSNPAIGPRRRIRTAALALPLIAQAAFAVLAISGVESYLDLPLQDLLSMEVSKKAQSICETAAAAFVITQKDIRRSGATSIAELLRMVPGFRRVAPAGNHTWLELELKLDAGITDCSVLFVTREAARNMQTLRAALNNQSVLTIGDAEDFAELGGMMQMSLKRKKSVSRSADPDSTE